MTQPVRQLTRADGTVARFYPTEEPFRFRVEIDGVPWDPNEMARKYTK